VFTHTENSTRVLEGGFTDTYTVALTNPVGPGQSVTVTLQSDGQVTFRNAADVPITTLTFTAANWNVPQTVKVVAVQDGVKENRLVSHVRHVVTSTDPTFSVPVPPTLNVTVFDDDTPGVIVTQSDGKTTVVEGGAGDSYTLQLQKAPAGPVTVHVT